MNELDEFRREVEVWFRENRPPEPDFLLPESFMEVGSDAQFNICATGNARSMRPDISVWPGRATTAVAGGLKSIKI